MKKLILVLAVLAFTQTNAQQIKMQCDKVDDMTGNIVKTTKSYKMASDFSQVWSTSLSRVNESTYLNIHVNGYAGCSGTVDGKAIVKLKNGATISLEEVSNIKCGNYKVFTYSLTDELMNTGQNIDKIRIYTTSGYTERAWEGKFSFITFLKAIK